MCGSMVDIQCPTAEIRRGNKKRRKKKPQDENIYVRILLCRAAIKTVAKASNQSMKLHRMWVDDRLLHMSVREFVKLTLATLLSTWT